MNITRTSTARNGSMAREMDSTRSPETDEATNNTNPMGGVARPTVKLTDIIIAKWTGWTPRLMNIGAKIGPRIIIAGPASKNIPTIKSKMLIRNNSISGLSLRPSMKAAICSGAWLRLTTVLNATAAPTSSRTVEDPNADFSRWLANREVSLFSARKMK